jgi:tetratricopeptide (TPR) repeat protein
MRQLLVVSMLVALPLSAQSRMPDSLVNTKFFDKSTPVRTVVGQMRAITGALGVRCTYCHVGDESMNIWDYDFASDEKPTKLKARVMLRMVQAINDEHLEQLADIGSEGITVTCATCHRGVALPIPLEDLLLKTHVDSGYEVMDAKYEELKRRYFGSSSYDFGEGTLSSVGGSLLQRGEITDAVKTYIKNVALFGESELAHLRAGEAQLAAGDTTAALNSYRRSLELNPGNPVAKQRIEALAPEG